jgi:hypothetical protein
MVSSDSFRLSQLKGASQPDPFQTRSTHRLGHKQYSAFFQREDLASGELNPPFEKAGQGRFSYEKNLAQAR